MQSIVGINFNVTKMLTEKFSGDDLRKYTEFRIHWDLIDSQLDQLGFGNARKLIELKKCVSGQALDTINRLPLDDGNYQNALDLLDRTFKRPIKFAELVVLDLLNAPKMGNESRSITTTLNVIEQAEQALDGLRLSKAAAGELVFAVICESKLNNSILKSWAQEKEKKSSPDSPAGHTASLDDLKRIIRQQKEIAEMFEQRKSDGDYTRKTDRHNETKTKPTEQKKSTIAGAFAGQRTKNQNPVDRDQKCLVCSKEGHKAETCFKLTKLNNPNERRQFLSEKKINICRNCMKGAHMTADCRQGPNCTRCHQRHHTLLHTNPVAANKASQERRPSESTSTPNQMAAASINAENSHPILQSCIAWLLSPSGETLQVRVFLDSGCEKSLIRRDVAHRLGLDGPTEDLCLVGIGGKTLKPTKEKIVKFRLRSRDGKYTTQQLSACTSEKITNPLRMVNVDPKSFDHLKDLTIADEFPRGEVQVDVLIGVDFYDLLLCGGVVRGKPQEPVALETKLGYVLSGVSE
jgi:hypothetical protein